MEAISVFHYLRAGQMKLMKGTKSFPSLFLKMELTNSQQKVKELVTEILTANPDYFLVEVKLRPGNNIKVVLDADSGVSIDKCVAYNRLLYRKIEEEGLFPAGEFSLEVSSPGTDEPLKLHRQYKKNIGRTVEVISNDGSKNEGKLVEVGDDGIIIEETRGKNKKKEVVMHTILFDNIKSTKIQVVF